MIKFKGFFSAEGGAIEDQVNEWLKKERPNTIYSSNLHVCQNGTNSILIVFYEDKETN